MLDISRARIKTHPIPPYLHGRLRKRLFPVPLQQRLSTLLKMSIKMSWFRIYETWRFHPSGIPLIVRRRAPEAVVEEVVRRLAVDVRKIGRGDECTALHSVCYDGANGSGDPARSRSFAISHYVKQRSDGMWGRANG